MLRAILSGNTRRRSIKTTVLALTLFVCGGCVTKEFSYVAVVSGGEQIKFTFSGGGPVHAKAEGIEILNASILPDFEAKKVFYGFQFSDASAGKNLQSVRVEDVSDPLPFLLFEDLAPKLTNRIWDAKTREFAADDPSLKWVSYVSESVRIYRFTVTMNDGRKVILHQPSVVPGWVKMAIRTMFGEKY
ncbi:MAG: hypothetical protein ABIZ81_14855 [Opitutaceae bacterium]